jgi:hypothetical protein
MSEQVVQRAVGAFMELTHAERPLYHGHDGMREWFDAVFGVFPDWRPQPRPASYGAGSGVPIDQTHWLGARVQAGKITFFGLFRTEPDAVKAVT